MRVNSLTRIYEALNRGEGECSLGFAALRAATPKATLLVGYADPHNKPSISPHSM